MEVEFSYLVKLDPNRDQEQAFGRWAGCARFIYNWSLGQDRDNYRNGAKKIPGHAKRCAQYKLLKKTHPWLQEPSDWVCQQKLRDLCKAWQNFFNDRKKKQQNPRYKMHFRPPTFKKKTKSKDSFRIQRDFKVDIGTQRVCLPKLGWVKFFGKFRNKRRRKTQRVFEGVPSSVTVSKKAGGWYASILVKRDIEISENNGSPIGLDLGIKTTITTSDGDFFNSPKAFKKYMRRLGREQRRLSRKQRGSRNRQKQRLKVAKVYKQVSDSRSDWLHKVTTSLAKNHSQVWVEDLAVKNMVRNRKLARSILDESWGRLRLMLEYKCKWYGSKLGVVDRWYPSSKTCSNCGCVKENLDLSERTYYCDHCGFGVDRDLNAARNILVYGTGGQSGTRSIDLDACGDRVRPKSSRQWSLKQEPARNRKRVETLATSN